VILPLDPRENLIIVSTRVFGPRNQVILRFALDTGATTSLLNWSRALKLGYIPDDVHDRREITTASRFEFAPIVVVKRFEALGQQRNDFPMLCHNLPPTAGIDGVLGLDFLRGHRLTIDFRIGLVILE
jgi:predicted aspartyl protease